MKPEQRRAVGKTTLQISRFGVGGTGFGNIYSAMEDQQANDICTAAIHVGLNFFDTAPLYGFDLSETRLGQGLRAFARSQFVISTKVGWSLVPLGANEENTSLFRETPRYRQVMDCFWDFAQVGDFDCFLLAGR